MRMMNQEKIQDRDSVSHLFTAEARRRLWRGTSVAALAITGAAAMGVTLLEETHAQIRRQPIHRNTCFVRGSAGDRGRQMGVRNASRLIQNAWARMGATCDQVDRLAQVIAETPLGRPYSGGEFGACFYQGYIDTVWGQLDQIYTRCGNACFNAGVEVGSISAQGYCAASLAIDGLLDPGFISQPSLPFCGQNLVFGCRSEYVHVATQEYPGCRLYTQGEFSETFDNFVRQDCFLPTDVPVRDGRF
jgi:hypothetical protein